VEGGRGSVIYKTIYLECKRPTFPGEDEDDDEEEPGSLEVGDDAFGWMIGPTEPKEFYATYWEKKPLHLKRADPDYYKDLFSTKGTYLPYFSGDHFLCGGLTDHFVTISPLHRG
jgi:hypothetical protein